MTAQTEPAIRLLQDRVQGKGGVWFVGSYACYSVPLLESGVQSAMLVCERLGVSAPWLAEAQRQGELQRRASARKSVAAAVLGFAAGCCAAVCTR